MSKFEEEIKKQINAAPMRSFARDLYKVVLGEWQRTTSPGNEADSIGYNIIRKIIVANEENIDRLPNGDNRIDQYKEENRILEGLMPSYLSVEDVATELESVVEQIKSAKSDGQAMGVAMKLLKSKDLSVEGGTVKEVVSNIRE